MNTILLLEDNSDRVAQFRQAVSALGPEYEMKLWHDAPTMVAECERWFPDAVLISLDHDLNPLPGSSGDPGTGLDVAAFLAECCPVCPVLVHSSNVERAWSMHNELRFAKWVVDRVGPIGDDWIGKFWLPKARELLGANLNTWPATIPADHADRLERAQLSLDGLSVGDGFGQCFFVDPEVASERIQQSEAPPSPWFYTDDTAMAVSIVRTLKRYGHVEPDALAGAFAREYTRDPRRGYGGTAHGILQAIGRDTAWQVAAGRVFEGEGSCGNGGAMRSAPIGAYFADDIARVISEARASAAVTHAHPDGQTGAIAIALAAAWFVQQSHEDLHPGMEVIEFVLEHLPQTETYYRLKKALGLPLQLSPATAACVLGNGSQVIASDTVPFCLWCAARHPNDYVRALWTTVSAFGDRDTTCAIVGGIVAVGVGRAGLPEDWLAAREPLPRL